MVNACCPFYARGMISWFPVLQTEHFILLESQIGDIDFRQKIILNMFMELMRIIRSGCLLLNYNVACATGAKEKSCNLLRARYYPLCFSFKIFALYLHQKATFCFSKCLGKAEYTGQVFVSRKTFILRQITLCTNQPLPYVMRVEFFSNLTGPQAHVKPSCNSSPS